MSLAVIIITYNEEKHIKKAIESAKLVTDEVIIIDSYSKDKTVEIAEKNGAKVFFRSWDDDFSAQRNFSLDKTTANWVLFLDADEVITTGLASSIDKVTLGSTEKVYVFKRTNVVFGKKFSFGVFKPDKVKRLFPRLSGIWQGSVHEDVKSNLPLEILSGELLHYPYDSWEQYFNKFNKYTTIWAESAYTRGKKVTLFGALIRATASFIKMFLINLSFLDGLLGIVLTCHHFSYTLTKYTKLYTLQKNK